jgi:8-oxo-dGTP diphosphatase
MTRAAALIVRDGQVALIERRNSSRGALYHLFPGGGIEAGESAPEAVAREAEEELGLTVTVSRLIADVRYNGNQQLYFAAEITGGVFGAGQGAEMLGQVAPEAGSYTPVWLPLADLLRQPVYPRGVAEIVVAAATSGGPAEPTTIVDDEQD